MLWEAYVVAAELALSLVGCIWAIRVASPGVEYTQLRLTPRPRSGRLRCAFHAACLAFFISVLVAELVKTHGHGLAFYTCWNFILQIIYWAWALLDARGVSRGRRVLLDVVFPASLLVMAVVWAILYPLAKAAHATEQLLNWTSYVQHGINVPLLGLEFYLVCADSIPMAMGGLPLLVLWGTLYGVAAWIIHEVTSFWPYPFMKVESPYAPLWYFLVCVLHIAFFGVAKGLSWLAWRPLHLKASRVESLDTDSSATARLLGDDTVRV
ncbi:hypothetical protein SDRG_13571 [Saprolegnia diclina VS20]|uniref:Uncharacterized protein n=1 Tax=Saprolegnia diclina (strain VS20) TaxID=1156394 RepID=T0Q2A3_SAPDV|nr:hypothetical protein SDRG_13571 [Saprolegnia diclina VS20]EQC28696.1 hypothetical protein SDRG_13571 [Saprolegnia diclina VS20]|eukprot:XP_008617888.1 hypothetical protein SDRG_13571 [Saprolegnia diclina VS20]